MKVKLIATAIVTCAVSAGAHATPDVYSDVSFGASTSLSRGGVDAWIDGYSSAGGEHSLCVYLTNAGSGRSDYGCAPGTVDIEPTLRTAHLAGTIPSDVYDADTGAWLGASTITVDVTLTGTGVPNAGQQTFTWYSLGTADPGSPPMIEADTGAGLSRDATADGSVSSSSMCSLASKPAPARVKPSKRRPRAASEPCVGSTGQGSGQGWIYEGGFSAVWSGPDSCGKQPAGRRKGC